MGKICAILREENERRGTASLSEEKERKYREINEFGFADMDQLS
jgi:hypothetical protein